ncbi:uncharacterized protein LOC143229937 [Tachypleus tridentatus]|uniref:uncharacterized protein LOC143229937 n=1 Tax=Tachypleus tridentatus TaxID=6853 RepID=UPI003FD020EA
MPGSITDFNSKVHRSDSTRSETSSDSRTSAKKVSFNNSVRVKKYPRRAEIYVNGKVPNDISREKRFWFKVYKNRHNEAPNLEQIWKHYNSLNPNREILHNTFVKGKGKYNTPADTQYTKHGSVQTSTKIKNRSGVQGDSIQCSNVEFHLPEVKTNHVKDIVERFNGEALLQFENKNDQLERTRDSEIKNNGTVLKSLKVPAHQQTSDEDPFQEVKPPRNKVVNGVKVIFGTTTLKQRDKNVSIDAKNRENSKQNSVSNHTASATVSDESKGPFSTNFYISKGSEEESFCGRSKRDWSSSLISLNEGNFDHQSEPTDVTNINTKHVNNTKDLRRHSLSSLDSFVSETQYRNDKFLQSLEERENVLENRKIRKIYEDEQSSDRRSAKPYDNLSLKTEKPTNYYYPNQQIEHWFDQNPPKFVKKIMNDKGIQCDKASLLKVSSASDRNEDSLRIIRSKDGFVSASDRNEDSLRIIRSKDGFVSASDRNEDSLRIIRSKDGFVSASDRNEDSLRIIRSKDGFVSASDRNEDSLRIIRSKDGFVSASDRNEDSLRIIRSKDGFVSASDRNEDSLRIIRSKDGFVSSSDRNEDSLRIIRSKDGFVSASDRNEDSLRIIRSKDGFVSAYSNAPILPEKQSTYKHRKYGPDFGSRNYVSSEAIFTHMQKGKEERKDLNDKFPSEGSIHDTSFNRLHGYSTSPSEEKLSKVKTKSHLFGFKLKPGFDVENEHETFHAKNNPKNCCDLDSELYQNNSDDSHHDISDAKTSDLSNESSDLYRKNTATPLSLFRETNPRKQTLKYENVSSQDNGQKNRHDCGRLWSRMLKEDYCHEMAPNDMPFLTSSHIRNDTNSIEKEDSLKERAFKDENVRVIGNEQDIKEDGSFFKDRSCNNHSQNESSFVQRDTLNIKENLADTHQPHQVALIKRSSSAATGNKKTEQKDRHYGHTTGSSAASGVSSSDSGSTRHHKPLVMYIPAIRQYDKKESDLLAPSWSVVSSKPGKHQKRGQSKTKEHTDDVISEKTVTLKSSSTHRKFKPVNESRNKSDLQRRHSMPKNKFSWFKWKVQVKPSREP